MTGRKAGESPVNEPDWREMWPRAVACCVIVAVALSFPAPETVESTERGMQPLSAAVSGNYTIAFMPLLTVLVNMFPRLMSQVQMQPLTTTTHARKLETLWDWERDSLCSMVQSAWTNPKESSHFYLCRNIQANIHCSQQWVKEPEDSVIISSTQIDDCTTLELRHCTRPTYSYNPQLAQCLPLKKK